MKLLCKEPWSSGLFLKKASRAPRESSDLGPIAMDGGQKCLELSKSVEIGICCFACFVALSQKCKLWAEVVVLKIHKEREAG